MYGLDFETDFVFRTPLLPAVGPSTLRFLEGSSSSREVEGDFEEVYASAVEHESGETVFRLLRSGERELLQFTGRADFLLDAREIRWWRIGSTSNRLIEHLFLSAVLAYWFERAGVPALHASAVAVGGDVIAFAARAGGGKSSLAAAFLGAGHSLVTDDLVLVMFEPGRIHVPAGSGQIKINPDSGRHFLGNRFDALPRFVPESDKRCWSFDPRSWRLRAEGGRLRRLYLLDRSARGDGEVRPVIEELGRRDAVIELLRATFTPVLVEGVGMAERRLDRLADLVREVPVCRLSYGSSLSRASEVIDAVATDLDRDGRREAGGPR